MAGFAARIVHVTLNEKPRSARSMATQSPIQADRVEPPAITNAADQPRPPFELPPPRRPGDTSRRYTWEQCYANLDMLWRHYGRAPRRHETHRPPSRISCMAYDVRFGSWTAALQAYEAYRAGDLSAWPMTGGDAGNTDAADPAARAEKTAAYRTSRLAAAKGNVPTALRYYVLVRDEHRCTACGADPKLDRTVRLHVDHKISVALGGETKPENLRVLCSECNYGKGARAE